MGDGRAMQGDGEVTGTALETSLRGTFDVSVRRGQRLRWPRADTPTHYYVVSQLDKDGAVYRDARRRSPAARASHDTAARCPRGGAGPARCSARLGGLHYRRTLRYCPAKRKVTRVNSPLLLSRSSVE